MKNTNKMICIFMIIILVLGICVPVFANTQTGTLTINNTKEGETYTLYKIFDLTYSESLSNDGNHAYTLETAFDGFFTNEKLEGFPGDTKDLRAVAYVESRKEDLADFATELQRYIIEKEITATKVVAGEDTTTLVETLEYGYYLLVPTDELSENGLSALFSLDTVKPNAEINNKAQYPTITKTIVEEGAEVDSNTVAIGENISYKITSMVPSLAGYAYYSFVITDTFDEGLTFNDDLVIRLVNGENIKELVEGTDYSLTKGGQVLTINFSNFIQYKASTWQGAEVIATYSAKVNTEAVVGTVGNKNTAFLTYSCNPADASETKNTTPEVVASYITGITLEKVNSAKETLTGAKFQLSGQKVNTVRVTGNQVVGEVQIKTEQFDVNAYVNEGGVLVFDGLSEGEYQITELVAPTGYHALAQPITVVVSCTVPVQVIDGMEECVWAVTIQNPNEENVTPAVENGRITLSIENQAGNELPFTGGAGTIAFTVVGVALMVCAVIAVVLVNRKKATDV